MVGLQENQTGALLTGLPDGFGGLHAQPLGRHVLRQDDAVAAVRVACDGDGMVLQLPKFEQLHGGVEIITVAVEDDPAGARLANGISTHRLPRPF